MFEKKNFFFKTPYIRKIIIVFYRTRRCAKEKVKGTRTTTFEVSIVKMNRNHVLYFNSYSDTHPVLERDIFIH